MNNTGQNGCTYGKDTRKFLGDALERIESKLDNHIYHLAKRPPWSVLVTVTILASLVAGLAVALLSR